MRLDDLTGKRFGRLTVIKRIESRRYPSGQAQSQYLCKCDCGKETKVTRRNLISGNTQSCGCYAIDTRTHHQMYATKVYKCWDNMRSRCLNPNSTGYANWGGRGIKIYPDWIHNFNAFYDYVSTLPHFGEEGRSLDRIDNNGNYEPNNLRWATKREQTLNSRKCLKEGGTVVSIV